MSSNPTDNEMAQTPEENEESQPAFAPENEQDAKENEEVLQETAVPAQETENEEEISE